jgi:hypothetical protein
MGSELGLASNEKGRYEKDGIWLDGARKIPTDRGYRRINKIILLLGLDFTRLHQ